MIMWSKAIDKINQICTLSLDKLQDGQRKRVNLEINHQNH